MAEPRKVQFVTLSAFAAGAVAESRKRRLEEEADFNFDGAGEVEAAGGAGDAAERRATLRLDLSLSEPDERSSAEFNYGELVQNLQVGALYFEEHLVQLLPELTRSCWGCFYGRVAAGWRVAGAQARADR